MVCIKPLIYHIKLKGIETHFHHSHNVSYNISYILMLLLSRFFFYVTIIIIIVIVIIF